MSSEDKTKLNGIATGANKYTHPTSSGNKHIPSGGSSGQILRWGADGTAVWGADNNTTYSPMSGATASKAGTSGLVPAPAAGKQGQFLRGDGTWATPTNTDTKVTNTLNTTAKAYITGTTSATTNTGTQVFDTGVYLDTTAGMLTAGTFKGALSGNASSATKLQTARTVRTNLGSTSTANFDGTANITPGVTGILPAANGGTGNTTGEASSVSSIQLTDEDLNSLSSVPGHLYYAIGGNGVTNKPSGIDNFGMFVMRTANGWYTQVLYGSDDDIWTRRWASSNWTSWVKIYSTGNKPTVSDIGAAAADHSHEDATISTSGMMSASDKQKLDGYPDDLSDYSTTDEMNNAIEMAVYGAIHSFY